MMFDLIIQDQPNSEPVQCNVRKSVVGNFDTHYIRMLVNEEDSWLKNNLKSVPL